MSQGLNLNLIRKALLDLDRTKKISGGKGKAIE